MVFDTHECKTAFLQHYLEYKDTQTVGYGVETQGLVVVKLLLTILCSLSGQHDLMASAADCNHHHRVVTSIAVTYRHCYCVTVIIQLKAITNL